MRKFTIAGPDQQINKSPLMTAVLDSAHAAIAANYPDDYTDVIDVLDVAMHHLGKGGLSQLGLPRFWNETAYHAHWHLSPIDSIANDLYDVFKNCSTTP
jgi:hypothetical protein